MLSFIFRRGKMKKRLVLSGGSPPPIFQRLSAKIPTLRGVRGVFGSAQDQHPPYPPQGGNWLFTAPKLLPYFRRSVLAAVLVVCLVLCTSFSKALASDAGNAPLRKEAQTFLNKVGVMLDKKDVAGVAKTV
jgi:hypothetical protein